MTLFYNANFKKSVFFQTKRTEFGFEIKWKSNLKIYVISYRYLSTESLSNMEFKLKFGIIVGNSVEALELEVY
jgi:hypothetical protein